MNKREMFIYTYENKIKNIRKRYYKNKVKEGLDKEKNTEYLFYINYIPVLLSIIICLLGSFSNKALIFSLIILLIGAILISIIKKVNHLYEDNYSFEIKKLGYFSIDKYEEDIKKYITGPDGYYKVVLQKYINQYKITKENTYTIEDTSGNEYLLHNNKDKDEIYIINNNLKEFPILNKLKYSNIRYYRIDEKNKRIILKTDLDELYYNIDSKIVFDKVIKSKKIDNQAEYKPEDYVNDFERYVNKIRNKETRMLNENELLKLATIKKIGLLLVLEILFIVAIYFFNDFKTIIGILYLIFLVVLSSNINKFLSISNIYIKNDKEYIDYLNKDKDCQDHFKELKLSLRIPNNIDKIYSDEGAEFLVWNNAGYFHLFLNLIYFNVIYIVVKIQDIEYYKVEGNYCTIKLKDKTYTFEKDAKKIFDKLLPNKDYDWTHGIIDKNKSKEV